MLGGAAIFLLLLIALLAVPLTLKFRMTWQQGLQSDIKLLWLFGLVCVRIPPFQTKSHVLENKDLVEKIDHFKHPTDKILNLFVTVRQKAFRHRIVRFMGDLWRAIHKDNVGLRLRIGVGDPADTGLLWALVGPVAGVLTNVQEVSIEIKPEFFDTAFELDSSGDVRLIPLQLIYLVVALLLSPVVWQGIKRMREAG